MIMIFFLYVPILAASMTILLKLYRFWMTVFELGLYKKLTEISAKSYGASKFVVIHFFSASLSGVIFIFFIKDIFYLEDNLLSSFIFLLIAVFLLRNSFKRLPWNKKKSHSYVLAVMLELGVINDDVYYKKI